MLQIFIEEPHILSVKPVRHPLCLRHTELHYGHIRHSKMWTRRLRNAAPFQAPALPPAPDIALLLAIDPRLCMAPLKVNHVLRGNGCGVCLVELVSGELTLNIQ